MGIEIVSMEWVEMGMENVIPIHLKFTGTAPFAVTHNNTSDSLVIRWLSDYRVDTGVMVRVRDRDGK